MSSLCSGARLAVFRFIVFSVSKNRRGNDPITVPLGMVPVSPVVRGCLWMSGAVFSFSAMAIAVRQLLSHMGVFEVLFFRTFIALVAVVAYAALTGFGPLRTKRIGMHTLRNISHFGGQFCWVFAIGALPLATVFAI